MLQFIEIIYLQNGDILKKEEQISFGNITMAKAHGNVSLEEE